MNLSKCKDFFDPDTIEAPIHIIGCGAVGSTLAEMLIRMGCTNLNLYDFDIVTPHNLANQMFRNKDINQPKVKALFEILKEINPDATININEKGYDLENPPVLKGYVFLAVDDISLRKQICTNNLGNMNIKAILDFRMGLSIGQHFMANWNDPKDERGLLDGMNFTTEEAAANAPRNACGTTLNIISTVRTICSLGLTNFMLFVKSNSKDYKHLITVDVIKQNVLTL